MTGIDYLDNIMKRANMQIDAYLNFSANIMAVDNERLLRFLDCPEEFAVTKDERLVRCLLPLKKEYESSPIAVLKSRFSLTPFEVHMLEISLLIHIDPNYYKPIFKNSVPTAGMLLNMFLLYADITILDFHMSIKKMSELFFCCKDELGFYTSLHLKKKIAAYLVMGRYNTEHTIVMPARENTIGKSDVSRILCVVGKRGSGKKTAVKAIADKKGMGVIFIDYAAVKKGLAKEEFAKQLAFEAALFRGIICVQNVPENMSADEKAKFISFCEGNISKNIDVIVTSKEVPFDNDCDVYRVLPLTRDESLALWQAQNISFANDVDFNELVSLFSISAGDIINAAEDAALLSPLVSKTAIYDSLYNRCSYDEKAAGRAFTWNDLIINNSAKNQLMRMCDRIRLKHKVFDDWGLGRRIEYGKGVSVLFTGPPGTGKTMAANVIASELNMRLKKVDISKTVSKYIGETEKNLDDIFNEGEGSNVILFFDEMDALFGKRGDVKDARDKYANMETSFLLQKIEQYEGVVIMSTNYMTNIDSAFMRRITDIVNFVLPDVKARLDIWKGIYPKEVPISTDVDFEYLANSFKLSGGIIKNTALSAAFFAAAEDEHIHMRHILGAVSIEIDKLGQVADV